MTQFIEKESYKHKFAKELLHKWLSESDIDGDYMGIFPIIWRKNYGVFSELKFYETSDPYYFEQSEGLIPFNPEDAGAGKKDRRGPDPLKFFDPSFNRGKILFVPDITIFHKGTPTIIIEVIHTSWITVKKHKAMLDFFSGINCTVYNLRAEDILRQTGVPEKLPIDSMLVL